MHLAFAVPLMLFLPTVSLGQADAPAARAIIMDPHGKPLPEFMPLGEAVVFSARSAIHGNGPLSVKWKIKPPERDSRKYVSPDGLDVFVPTGTVDVTIEAILSVALDNTTDVETITVKCGNGPRPPPIPPPDPPQPPIPPPVPGKLLGVLIVETWSDRPRLPTSQAHGMSSANVRQYLNEHVEPGVDGVPRWRRLDKGTDVTNEEPIIKELMARFRSKQNATPYLLLKVGNVIQETPLPANEAAMLEYLKRFGGP